MGFLRTIYLKQTTERIVLCDISQMTQMERWVLGEPSCGAIQSKMEKDYARYHPVKHHSILPKWKVGSLEKKSVKQNHETTKDIGYCSDVSTCFQQLLQINMVASSVKHIPLPSVSLCYL